MLKGQFWLDALESSGAASAGQIGHTPNYDSQVLLFGCRWFVTFQCHKLVTNQSKSADFNDVEMSQTSCDQITELNHSTILCTH